jgi:hypothetical protein
MAAGDVERTDGRPSAHLLSLDVQLVVMASEANLASDCSPSVGNTYAYTLRLWHINPMTLINNVNLQRL